MRNKKIKKSHSYWHSKIIKELREDRGLTQTDLSDLSKVSVDTIYKIEQQINVGNFETIEKLLIAMNHELEIVPMGNE